MATLSSRNNFRLTVIAHSVGLALTALAAAPAFAVPTCPSPDSNGLITVTTTLTNGCYLPSTTPLTSLSVSGTGSISGYNNYDGISVSGGTYNSIHNDGVITTSSAGWSGLSINGAHFTGDLRNGTTGTISNTGGGNAININNSIIDGVFENTGTIIGDIRIANGSQITGSIVNTEVGSISGGINVFGGSIVHDITNAGTADHIYVSSASSGAISNSGTVQWIDVSNGHVAGAISNTGTVTNGIYVGTSSSVSGGISNSGTVGGIYVSDNSIVTGGIINTGLVNGEIYLGGSTLNLNGTTGRVVGSISGNSGSTVNVNGIFTMENTFDVGAVNIAQAGALNMGANNYIAGSVTNSGTLSVNPGVSNDIYGDYSQTATGVFQSNVSGIAQYGKLQVHGTADLTQGSIRINTSTPSLMLTDGAVDTILSATTLNFNPNIAVTDTSLLFDFQATQVGNDIQLKTVASSDNGDTATGSVNNQGNSAGRGAAAVIDQLIGQGSSAPAAFLPVINALGTLDSQKKVSDAISQTLPLMTAGMTQSTLNTLHGTNQVIQSRQDANLGRSSGDEFLGDRQFWFKPLGSWAKQNDRNGVAGYDADTYGMVFGVDGTLSDKSSIGGAFAYTSTKVDSNSDVAKQHADVDGYQLAVYGAYKLDDRVSVTYQGDIGNNQVSGDRRIAFMSTTANSDFSSWSAHVGAGIGKTMDLSERTTFTPSVRVDYTRLRTDSYTEKGAGALNLHADGDTVEELILGVDAAFSHMLSTNASLIGNLGVGYDTMNEGSSVTASYVGGGAAFVTKGIDPSPWVMRGGLGIVMHNGPLVSVTARYDLEARESFTNQTASVKVDIKF